jgi:hypothetical protein
LKIRNALCSYSAVEEEYFWSETYFAFSIGFCGLETSNKDIFNPSTLPSSVESLPIPIK